MNSPRPLEYIDNSPPDPNFVMPPWPEEVPGREGLDEDLFTDTTSTRNNWSSKHPEMYPPWLEQRWGLQQDHSRVYSPSHWDLLVLGEFIPRNSRGLIAVSIVRIRGVCCPIMPGQDASFENCRVNQKTGELRLNRCLLHRLYGFSSECPFKRIRLRHLTEAESASNHLPAFSEALPRELTHKRRTVGFRWGKVYRLRSNSPDDGSELSSSEYEESDLDEQSDEGSSSAMPPNANKRPRLEVSATQTPGEDQQPTRDTQIVRRTQPATTVPHTADAIDTQAMERALRGIVASVHSATSTGEHGSAAPTAKTVNFNLTTRNLSIDFFQPPH